MLFWSLFSNFTGLSWILPTPTSFLSKWIGFHQNLILKVDLTSGKVFFCMFSMKSQISAWFRSVVKLISFFTETSKEVYSFFYKEKLEYFCRNILWKIYKTVNCKTNLYINFFISLLHEKNLKISYIIHRSCESTCWTSPNT